MKKKNSLFRKATGTFLAVVMLLSCWVFTPLAPKAEAADAGSYAWKVRLLVQEKYDWKHDAMNVYVDYVTNNGYGNYYKCDNSTYKNTASYFSVTKNQFENDNADYTFTGSCSGFPCAVRLDKMKNNNSMWNANYRLYLWVAKAGTTSWTQIIDTGKVIGIGSDEYLKKHEITSTNDNWPKATNISSFSISATSKVIPTPGSSAVTVTATMGTITDQYGVNWYQDPYVAVSGNSGVTASNRTTVSVSSSAMLTASPWYSNCTVTAHAGSATGTKVGSDLTLKVSNPTFTVTYNKNAAAATCSETSKSVTYNNTYGTLVTPTRPGYHFDGWYTAASGGTKIISDTKVTITSAQTLYAHWTPYKATFSYKTAGVDNNNGGGSATTTVLSADDSTGGKINGTPPQPLPYWNNEGHYIFSHWEPAFDPNKAPTSDVTYVAQYVYDVHGHVYEATTVSATTTSPGYTKYKCKNCEDVYYINYVAPTSNTCSATKNLPTDSVYFNVPEAIYLTPNGTSFQYVLDQTMGTTGGITANTGYKNISSGGNIDFYYKNAIGVSIKAESSDFSTLTLSTGKSFNLSNTASAKGHKTLTSGSVNASKSGYIKWTATYTDKADELVKTVTAYTYVYAPFLESVATYSEGHNYGGLAWINKNIQGATAYFYGIHDVSKVNTNASFYLGSSQKSTSADDKGNDGGYRPSGVNPMLSSSYTLPESKNSSSVNGMDSNAKGMTFGGYDGAEGGTLVVSNWIGKLNIDTSRQSKFNQIPNLTAKVDIYKGLTNSGDCAIGDTAKLYTLSGSWSSSNTSTEYDQGALVSDLGSNPDGYIKPLTGLGNISTSGVKALVINNNVNMRQAKEDRIGEAYTILEVNNQNRQSLRAAVISAQNLMAKYCANGTSSYIYSGTKWNNFVTAYENAYKALTKIDAGIDSALVTNLNNAISAVNNESKSHALVSVASDTPTPSTVSPVGLRAGQNCVHCDYSTRYPADYRTVCTGTGELVEISAPTCTQNGESRYPCICGYIVTVYPPALGHSFGEATYDWSGTSCTATRECTVCHDTETETKTATVTKTQDKSCVLPELSNYTVTFTNAAFAEQTKINVETAEPLGHIFENYVYNNDVSCTSDGTKTGTCSRCGEKDTITDENYPAPGHSWGDWYVAEGDEPTCTKTGIETRICSVCEKTEQQEIGLLPHDIIYHEAQAATCTEIGWNAYDTCSRCDYSTYVEIPALDHAWGTPTYTWNGTSCTAERVCSRDASHKETETVTAVSTGVTQEKTCVLDELSTFTATFTNSAFTAQTKENVKTDDAFGHTEVIDPAVPATENTIGYTQGSHCSVCDEIIVTQTLIPMLGHSEAVENTEFKTEYEAGETNVYIGIAETCDNPNAILAAEPESVVSLEGDFGRLTVTDEGKKASFELNSMVFSNVQIFYIVTKTINTQTGEDVFAYEKVTVVPSQILYFEDSFVTETTSEGGETKKKTDGIVYTDGTTVPASNYGKWIECDSPEIPGDASGTAAFSNGKAHKVSVSELNQPGKGGTFPKAEFKFAGTGFDIVSVTDSESGIFTYTIYKVNSDGTEERIKSKIVDTYYGYSYGALYYDTVAKKTTLDTSGLPLYKTNIESRSELEEQYSGEELNKFVYFMKNKIYSVSGEFAENGRAMGWVQNESSTDSLYQVPVIHVKDLTYGTYRVVVEAKFTDLHGHFKTDSSGNKYFDLCIDAVRIYDPAKNSHLAQEAYAAKGEAEINYTLIRDAIIGSDKIEGISNASGALFFDGHEVISSENLGDYMKASPNNEIYLAPNQSISFELDSSSYNDVQIGMKALNSKSVTVEISYGTDTKYVSINTMTEEYHSLLEIFGVTEMRGTVVIKNSDSLSGILSMTSIRTMNKQKVSASAVPKPPMRVSATTAPAAKALIIASETKTEPVIDEQFSVDINQTVEQLVKKVIRVFIEILMKYFGK